MNHVEDLVATADMFAKVRQAVVGAVLEPGQLGEDGGRPLLNAAKLSGEPNKLVWFTFHKTKYLRINCNAYAI